MVWISQSSICEMLWRSQSSFERCWYAQDAEVSEESDGSDIEMDLGDDSDADDTPVKAKASRYTFDNVKTSKIPIEIIMYLPAFL